MKPIDISQRVLNEAERQATLASVQFRRAFQIGALKSWQQVEARFNIVIPDTFKALPWSAGNFFLFCDSWKLSFAERLRVARDGPAETKKIYVDKDVTTFGNMTLKPEQEGAFKAIVDSLIEKRAVKAAINDGLMGSGKTYLGVALIAYLINVKKILDNPLTKLKPHAVIIITPKKVMESWKRVIDKAGLGSYLNNRKIFVMGNGELNTQFGDMYCSEQEDPVTGEPSYIWNPMMAPELCILDECHNFIRPSSTRTKKIHALAQCKQRPKFLLLSATLAEKVNDGLTYCVLSDVVFNGMRISKDNFSQFARILDKNPQKPSIEGVKRLRGILENNIFSFPYVKPKHKAYNSVWLVDFESPRDQIIYNQAQERYLEVCRKVGKNTDFGKVHQYVALTNFRKTAEPLRVGPIAHRAAENFRLGNVATAIGTAYIETVAELMFRLKDKYGIERKDVSIIWGGKREYNPKDLLSKEEIDATLKKGLAFFIRDRDFVRKLKLSVKYMEDKEVHGETNEEQIYRHAKLKELRMLGKQSDNEQQCEIDNFQDGTTKILIFTLASGGVGLSFDKDKPELLPREGIFTPVYNGKEFQQALGRTVRRESIADAHQYICMLNGTVESQHVAPILDIKLKTSAVFSNRAFSLVDLLERPYSEDGQPVRLRTDEEVAADTEKDETLVSDYGVKEDDEEDDDIEDAEDLIA